MPIWLAAADTRRWLIATATGHLSLEDLITFIATHRVGDRLSWPLLFDASAASTDIESPDLERLAHAAALAKHQRGTARAPVALIPPNDPAACRLMEFYKGLCDEKDIGVTNVFWSREDAERWLTGVAG